VAIVGVGVDVCDTDRFARVLARTPRIVERLFTERERIGGRGAERSAQSLAARFAAKEAVAKVLGDTHGLRWHDCEITTDEHGAPHLVVHDTVAIAAERLGIEQWHLSMSHDGGMAIAFVVAEGGDAGRVSSR
jgi:holo-[acyl-carrier protein] synthase